jgi:hypothetical protein
MENFILLSSKIVYSANVQNMSFYVLRHPFIDLAWCHLIGLNLLFQYNPIVTLYLEPGNAFEPFQARV